MNYVYDVTVNFKSKYLDFFEWNKNDKLLHIRKMPILKIPIHDLICIMTNTIFVDGDFLKRIKQNDKYICMFLSEDSCIVCQFNDKGNSILKSSLIVDEELDIIENYYNVDHFNLKYKKGRHDEIRLITRNEKEKQKFLFNEINKLSIPNDNNKIKYLYFECFGDYETDSNKALLKLKDSLNNNKRLNDLYKFFKLIETN